MLKWVWLTSDTLYMFNILVRLYIIRSPTEYVCVCVCVVGGGGGGYTDTRTKNKNIGGNTG